MSGIVDLQPTYDSTINAHVTAIALEYLHSIGDDAAVIEEVNEDRDRSSDEAQIYWVDFNTETESGIVEVIFFSNGTHKVSEV